MILTQEQEQELFSQIIKLLNKAGQDPRLTPRVLRKKLEEKMKLSEGSLKDNREDIKKSILKWFKKNCEGNNTINTITSLYVND
jgi:hypothetical protein